MLKSIQKLQELSPYEISLLIKSNHPQIIAQICYQMDDVIAGEVLSQMTERLRHEVVLRISTLYDMDTVWLNRLDEDLMNLIENRSSQLVLQEGRDKVASILSTLDDNKKESYLSYIIEYDPEHGQRIQNAISILSKD